MQIGDILLVHGENSIISRAIEDLEGSIYTHTAGIVKENEIIEAEGFKATSYEPLSKYTGYTDIFTCDILIDKQKDGIVKYVEKEVGSHYDWVLLFLGIYEVFTSYHATVQRRISQLYLFNTLGRCL